MSLSKAVFYLFCLTIAATGSASAATTDKPPLRYQCPASFEFNGKAYPFLRASVFDDQPEQRVNLAPETQEKRNRWEIDATIKPYLVCRYEGVLHTITFFAAGAKYCEFTMTPRAAYCQ